MVLKYSLATACLMYAVLACSPVAAVSALTADGGQSVNNHGLPWQQVRTLAEIMERVKRDYVNPVSDKTLIHNAIRGMLAGLDPHSAYLDPSDYKEMQISTSGSFGGLGLEIGMQGGLVTVVSPIDGSPAAKAGIRAEDRLLKIDATSLEGLSLDEVTRLMRGNSGSQVDLTISRDQSAPKKFHLTRSRIQLPSVKSHLLEHGYAYIRLSEFREQAGEELRQSITTLKNENGAPLYGVVLDLRDNPGGLLESAVAVANVFMNSGTIVAAKGRTPDSNLRRSATAGDAIGGAPVIVLVNGGTASAAEIVAGALQDNKRALIAGEQTFGKGSVQTVMPLADGAALKLTTARYYTPAGRSIQAEGITPDVKLPAAKITSVPHGPAIIHEADLSRHLANPRGRPAPRGRKHLRTTRHTLKNQDFQVYEALNMLKGLHILKRR